MSRKNKKKIPEKVTIKYLADVAGVSPSTVSRALNPNSKASSKTTERIKKIAKELHYFPDSVAKSLRERKTRTIGIILNDLNNPFYTEVLSVIGEMLDENNYSMIVNYSNWDSERERKNILSLLSKKVDGMIISPVDDKSENINLLFENDVESVLIDCYPYFKNTSYVYTDHGKGAEIATEYLIKNGHKEILLLTGPFKSYLASQFLNGYKKILKKYNLPIKEELIARAKELSIDGGYNTFKEIIQRDSKKSVFFTAIITISDLLAIGIYKVINELELDIPGNYSIIGYDNIKFTTALKPPLTTVHQPRRRIGLNSTRILLNNIENKNKKTIERVGYDPNIVIRGSVRNLR